MADITTSSLDGILKGNTSSRPASSNNGDLYINTETGFIEIYSSTNGWEAVGAAPSTVTSVSATDVPSGRAYNNGSASVSFTAGSIAGKSYTVTSSPGSYTATGSSSPLTVTGLQSSTQYTYTVTASNNYGTSATSSASAGVTATTVPQAPTVSAEVAGETTATITITAGATGGSAITQYSIVSNPATTTQTTSSSPYTFTGLTTGTAYTFTATATNANGTSLSSSASNSVTPINPDDYIFIEKRVLSSNSTSVTFNDIPQTYQNLQIFATLANTASGGAINNSVYFNNDVTGSNYQRHFLQNSAVNGIAAGGAANATFNFVYAAGSTYTDVFCTNHINIYNYTSTVKAKSIHNIAQYNTNGRGSGLEQGFGGIYSGVWKNNNAINSITFEASSGQIASGSTFWLYGIKG